MIIWNHKKIFKSLVFIACMWLCGANISTAAVGERLNWGSGLTLLGFFEQNLIPLKLYYNLSPQDKELTAEVKANATYYTLRNDSGDLLHALIPISDSVQMHIYKVKDTYKLDFIPIIAFAKSQTLVVSVQNSPYQDILNATSDILLATEFSNIYKKSVASRTMHAGDRLAIVFERDYRLGKPFGIPNIQASMIETAKKQNFVFLHTNGHYYDSNAKEMAGFTLEVPVQYTRISSRFSHGRKHPILKIVRPHYGVDYVAKAGTPIRAAASGKVVFAGVRGGYGKVVEIAHEGGLKTLYAHMQSIHTRLGAYVRSGTIIGRVGSTGMSTGPHLHFGVYKFNQPINPLGRIRTAKSELSGKEKKEFLALAKDYADAIDSVLESSDFTAQQFYLITKE
mgnify:CR=1 FL=1